MPRKVSLPGAAELFRPTQADDEVLLEPKPTVTAPARSSGRVRHDEKITVYVSSQELLALEQARLQLRAEHGIAVDRGRIVREAVATLLEGLEADGEDSTLVRRLRIR